MTIPQREIDKERAREDFFKYDCPDVAILTPAPEIECKCGFKGKAKVIISYLHEALCPECKQWIGYKEKE